MSVIPLQVPDIGTPLFDLRTGVMNPIWFQYFQILVLRTGGESGSDDGDFAAEILVLQKRATDVEGADASLMPVHIPRIDPVPSDIAVIPIAEDSIPGPVSVHGQQYDPSLHALVTASSDGFMSASDKAKLDGISGTPVTSVSGTAPIVSSGGSTPVISIIPATPSVPGSMSAADKAKLDGIVGGATSCFMVYQNSPQAISIGTQTAINYAAVVFDDTSEFSLGLSAFVAANTGTYVFNAGVAGSQTTATRRQVSIYVNGAQRIVIQDATGNGGNCSMSGTSGPMKLTAGDQVQVRYFTSIAENTSPGQIFTYFGGWRIK